MGQNIDSNLLERFEKEYWRKIPHLKNKDGKVANATPLVDITQDLKECAKKEFNINLDDKNLKIFGKYDSNLLAGSIKVRPAINII